MTYTVRITPAAEASIRGQARYIAIDEQAPLNAARWLQRIDAAADSLAQWPRRYRDIITTASYNPFLLTRRRIL